MFCTLCRWLISRAEDTGKKLPGIAEGHIRRCPACGEYARDCASLAARLRAERSAWLVGVPDFPPLPALEGEASPAALPSRRPRFALRPLPAAAAALLVIAGALVVSRLAVKAPEPSEADRAAAMEALRSLSAAPREFPEIVGEAESPLVAERRILESSVASAVEYLQDRLNIKIERRRPAANPS